MRRGALVLLAGATAVALVAACARKPADTEGSALGAGRTKTVAQSTGDKRHKIALIMKASTNPFFATMAQGAEKAAAELGNVDLATHTITDESSDQQQIDIVQSAIVRRVDAILIAPADSKSLVAPLLEAQKAGIAVINVDNRLDAATVDKAGLKLVSYVGADNEEGGRIAGRHLCELLGGSGKVAMLEGRRGVDNAEARKRGFMAACAEFDGIEIVASEPANWDEGEARDKFAAMMAAKPEIQGLFCANDNMAIGAIAAIREKGRIGDIVVVSYDNIEAAKQAIRDGTIAATIEQHPDSMGYEAVKLAVDHLEGREVEPEVLVDLELITKEKL